MPPASKILCYALMYSALLAVLPAMPTMAATLEVDLHVEDPQAAGTSATITASPVVGNLDRETPQTIEMKSRIPGKVELDLSPDLTWRVVVEASGFWAPDTLILGGSRQLEATVRLVPTATLVSRIKLPAAAEPRKPVEIEGRLRSPSETSAKSTPADVPLNCPVKEGIWRCEVPSGTFDLRLRSRGFISHYFWDLEIPPRAVLDLGDLELKPGASIVGWIETDDGAPLRKGLRIEASSQSMGLGRPRDLEKQRSLAIDAPVDERGFFQIAGLPPGAYILSAEQEGYVSARTPPVQVLEATESELMESIVLTRPSDLRVTVDPPADSENEPWSLKLLSEPGRPPVSTGRVDRDGSWTARSLKPGRYLLIVEDSEKSRVSEEELIVEGPLQEHWILLRPIEIEGRVTLGGEPLEALVAFGGKSGLVSIRMETDDEGRFSGTLPHDGAWPVDLHARTPKVVRRLRAVEVEAPAGSPKASVEIDLPGTRIEGEVVDADGGGIPRAVVIAIPVPRKAGDPAEGPSSTLTESGGLFSFEGFAPATYRLQAVVTSRSGQRTQSEPVEVDLSESDPYSVVRLVVAPALVFRGRVLSGDIGVPGASVSAVPMGGVFGLVVPQTRTGPDGRFEVGLPGHDQQVELTIMAPGFLLYREVVSASVGEELPIWIEQEGGGTLIVVHDETIEQGRRGLPSISRVDGVHFDFGTLSRWSQLNGASPVTESIEIPRMPSDTYRVCWPASTEESSSKHKPDCRETYLPVFGRVVISLSESSGE